MPQDDRERLEIAAQLWASADAASRELPKPAFRLSGSWTVGKPKRVQKSALSRTQRQAKAMRNRQYFHATHVGPGSAEDRRTALEVDLANRLRGQVKRHLRNKGLMMDGFDLFAVESGGTIYVLLVEYYKPLRVKKRKSHKPKGVRELRLEGTVDDLQKEIVVANWT